MALQGQLVAALAFRVDLEAHERLERRERRAVDLQVRSLVRAPDEVGAARAHHGARRELGGSEQRRCGAGDSRQVHERPPRGASGPGSVIHGSSRSTK